MTVKDGSLTITDTGQLNEKLCAAIASIEKGSGGLKVKFYDKLKALELLGKHCGLFDGTGGDQTESPLLQSLLTLGREDPDDIQQETEIGDDLVEQADDQIP